MWLFLKHETIILFIPTSTPPFLLFLFLINYFVLFPLPLESVRLEIQFLITLALCFINQCGFIETYYLFQPRASTCFRSQGDIVLTSHSHLFFFLLFFFYFTIQVEIPWRLSSFQRLFLLSRNPAWCFMQYPKCVVAQSWQKAISLGEFVSRKRKNNAKIKKRKLKKESPREGGHVLKSGLRDAKGEAYQTSQGCLYICKLL